MDSVRDTDGAQAALTQPNPENKLFVGGAPPGTDEDTLKKIFAEHGEVEEVFVMRGGSRSGQACAFVRFTTAEGAVAAIQAIHGKFVMPGCSDPLVVRYADAPGSRVKKGSNRTINGYPGFGCGAGPQGYGMGSCAGYGGPAPNGGYGGQYGGSNGWGNQQAYGGFNQQPPTGFLQFGNLGPQGGYSGISPGGLGAYGGMNQPISQNNYQQQQPLPRMMGMQHPNNFNGNQQPQMQQTPPVVVSGKPIDGVADWAGYTAPDGRTYYYNAKTGVSTWEKPSAISSHWNEKSNGVQNFGF